MRGEGEDLFFNSSECYRQPLSSFSPFPLPQPKKLMDASLAFFLCELPIDNEKKRQHTRGNDRVQQYLIRHHPSSLRETDRERGRALP